MKAKVEATPGPWKQVKCINSSSYPIRIEGADGFSPCLMYGDGRLNKGTTRANANLVCAVQEMVQVLKWIANSCHYPTCNVTKSGHCTCHVEPARIVLKKAGIID